MVEAGATRERAGVPPERIKHKSDSSRPQPSPQESSYRKRGCRGECKVCWDRNRLHPGHQHNTFAVVVDQVTFQPVQRTPKEGHSLLQQPSSWPSELEAEE